LNWTIAQLQQQAFYGRHFLICKRVVHDTILMWDIGWNYEKEQKNSICTLYFFQVLVLGSEAVHKVCAQCRICKKNAIEETGLVIIWRLRSVPMPIVKFAKRACGQWTSYCSWARRMCTRNVSSVPFARRKPR